MAKTPDATRSARRERPPGGPDRPTPGQTAHRVRGEAPEADLASLDEATTSGMGLEILRRCSDLLRYRHEGGLNHLTFGARWSLQ